MLKLNGKFFLFIKRGGNEKGLNWYQMGKLSKKMNTFLVGVHQ